MYPAQLANNNKLDFYPEDFFPNRTLANVEAFIMYTKTWYMHRHQFYEINIISEGEGRHYVEHQVHDAPVGCVFPLPPGVRHGYYAPNEIAAYHILLHPSFFTQYARELSILPGYPLLFEIEPYLRQSSNNSLFLTLDQTQMNRLSVEFYELLDFCNGDIGGKEVLKNAKVLTIIALLSDWISAKPHIRKCNYSHKYTFEMIQSMEYIQQHYNEKLTIENLASIAHMSRSAFAAYFLDFVKCPPKQYQIQCRLKKARELLLYTSFSATEIAQECGFYDSSHFNRIFELAEGVCPLQFRKNALNAVNKDDQ